MRKQLPLEIKHAVIIISLLLVTLVLVCVRCYTVIRENQYDERIIGTYECEASYPTKPEWQYLSLFSDGSFGIYGPRYDLTAEVERGQYSLDEPEEGETTPIELISEDGTTSNGVHFRDRIFIERSGTIYCFHRTAPVPASWSFTG